MAPFLKLALDVTSQKLLAWLPLQSLAVKKNFFCHKLCKYWAVKNFQNYLKSAGEIFLSGLRGAKNISVAFRTVFRIFFRVFQTVFRIDLKFFGGSFVLQTCRPKKLPSRNQRCFLNDVFQSDVFRRWSGSARPEGTRMLENASVFRRSLSF